MRILMSGLLAALATFTSVVAIQKPSHKDTFHIAHIISVMPTASAEQDAVLNSMALASKRSVELNPRLAVTLVAVQMQDELPLQLPSGFQRAAPLANNTAVAYAGCKKELPFTADVIRAAQSTAKTADAYVMTNADINVVPRFYDHVAGELLAGADGLNILKVEIPTFCDGIDLRSNASEADRWCQLLPQNHPGSDCFVWRSNATDAIVQHVGSTFSGFRPYAKAMREAFSAVLSPKYKELPGRHWTYHFGFGAEHTTHTERDRELTRQKRLEDWVQRKGRYRTHKCKFEDEEQETATQLHASHGAVEFFEEDPCDYASLNDANHKEVDAKYHHKGLPAVFQDEKHYPYNWN